MNQDIIKPEGKLIRWKEKFRAYLSERRFQKFKQKKKLLPVLIIAIILIALPIVLLQTKRSQDLRQHASSTTAPILDQQIQEVINMENRQKELLSPNLTPTPTPTKTTVKSFSLNGTTGAPVLPPPTITSCGDITTSGSYQLIQDLINPAGYSFSYVSDMPIFNVCIHIHDSSNVTLDCQGHKISADQSHQEALIVIENTQNFTLKNCNLYADNGVPVLLVKNSSHGLIEGNSFNPISSPPMVNIESGNAIEVKNNLFNIIYWQGASDPLKKGFSSQISNVNVHNNKFSVPIISDGPHIYTGKDNIFSSNEIDGNWDEIVRPLDNKTAAVGADDGMVIGNEEHITVSNNTIKNAWDCGIETLGMVKNSTFSNNRISNTAYCGIGAWWNSSWVGNTVNGNIVDKSSYLFQFFYLKRADINDQHIYFQDNSFTDNSFSNRVNSSYLGDTKPQSSVFDYASLIYGGISPSIVSVSNNAFKNNNFGSTYQSPLMIPQTLAVDGGGNICQQYDGATHPLKCVAVSNTQPSPTATPSATPTSTPSPTPTQIPTVTLAPGETALKLSVKLPGIGKVSGDNDNPVRKVRQATVSISDVSDKVVTAGKIGTLNYNSANGRFEGLIGLGDSIASSSGSYTVKVKMDNTLFRRAPGIVTIIKGSQQNTVIPFELISGDIDQNNSLTIDDYNLFYACTRNLPACTSDVAIKSDLNEDGSADKNNSDDMNILQRGFAVHEGD